MSEQYSKKYCSICGKRIVPHTKPQTYTQGLTTTTYTFYFSDSSEPICYGHKAVTVPQAFYDAFKCEDLRP